MGNPQGSHILLTIILMLANVHNRKTSDVNKHFSSSQQLYKLALHHSLSTSRNGMCWYLPVTFFF